MSTFASLGWPSTTGWHLWLVVGAACVGYAVGVRLSRDLRDAAYRIDDETSAPLPRARWLVSPAVGVCWGLLAWRLGERHSGLDLPAYLVLATVGVALARIDADVHRLPAGLTYPAAVVVAGLLAVSSALTGNWAAVVPALVTTGMGAVVYVVLVLLSGGQFGWGDVVLGTILAGALGYLSPVLPWLGILLAFVFASVVSVVGMVTGRITLKSRVAFGPYLLVGALTAILLVG